MHATPPRPTSKQATPNKFRIWKERHVQMRKPYQSPGSDENSSYYIAPVGDRTHDLPHTVASNMDKVSHDPLGQVTVQRRCYKQKNRNTK